MVTAGRVAERVLKAGGEIVALMNMERTREPHVSVMPATLIESFTAIHFPEGIPRWGFDPAPPNDCVFHTSDPLRWRASRREPGSYPIRADASTRRQALSDRLHGDIGLVNDLIQAAQGKAVDHLLAAALGVDKPAVPQAGQVGADPRLRLRDSAYELTNSPFPLFKQLEDVQPGRISQDTKKACSGGAIVWS